MLLSPDPALLLIKTPSAATALKSLTSFSSVHTIIDLITNSDWCISIPAVSFSNLFPRQSAVARLSCCCVFRWWASTLLQFLFHYPCPCFQVKSYMNCLFDPARLVIRVISNKIYFVPEWHVSGVGGML